MKPEDRAFLEQALKSMTLNVVDELNKAMKILMEGNASEDDQVQALEVVTNYVEDMDTANGKLNSSNLSSQSMTHCVFLDFHKIGGFCIILPGLNSQYAQVRSETAQLIGELAQNNPYCQQHLLDLNVLQKLIEMMSDEAEVATHAFHAISCIIRSYEPGTKAFVSMGGLECLLCLIQSPDREKIVIKSMFLINAFAQDWPEIRDELVKLNAVERIIETLKPKDEYDTRLEQTLAALLSLIESREAIKRCQNEKLKLKGILGQIMSLGDGKEECQVSCSLHLILHTRVQ